VNGLAIVTLTQQNRSPSKPSERDECSEITLGMVEAGLEVLMMYPEFADDRSTVKKIFKAMSEARQERRSASWLAD
jgi:hypothetical protein